MVGWLLFVAVCVPHPHLMSAGIGSCLPPVTQKKWSGQYEMNNLQSLNARTCGNENILPLISKWCHSQMFYCKPTIMKWLLSTLKPRNTFVRLNCKKYVIVVSFAQSKYSLPEVVLYFYVITQTTRWGKSFRFHATQHILCHSDAVHLWVTI